MKIRKGFVTNSSSSSFIICFARIADKEKAQKIIDQFNLDVLDVTGVNDERNWSGELGASWCGAVIYGVDDILEKHPDGEYIVIKDSIELPQRATKGSAGYDFYSPLSFVLEPGETIKIPTGIRCGMNNDWVLMLFPRSGLGFKYRIRLENTVGIIDSDYFYSDNEGHIMVKITNEGVKTMKVAKGDGFCQGIFLPYGITEDDKTEGTRNGGFGSTDK